MSTMKKYLSSLDKNTSEKFKRIDFEGEGDEYLDKDAILEHYFIGSEKNTMTRAVGYRDDEEGSVIQQKWDAGSKKWEEVGDDYRKTTKDPRLRNWRNDLSFNEPGAFNEKFTKWAETALPNERFLDGDVEQVSNRMMIDQLKYSKNPKDIIIKKPKTAKSKIASVRRQRDKSGKHKVGPIIYKFEDGSEWMKPESHSSRSSFKEAEKTIGKSMPYYKSIYGPKGKQIAGGDLSSVGWVPVENINDKIMNHMKKDDEWKVTRQGNYQAGR